MILRLLLLLPLLAGTVMAAPKPEVKLGMHLGEELRVLTSAVNIHLRDHNYVLIDHAWLEKTFIPHFRAFLLHLRVNAAGDGMDCDNYVELFRAQLVISNMLAGGHRWGDVPCAFVTVLPVKPFARIPAGGADSTHAVALVRTNTGWHVVEPQTSTLRPLKRYPNRHTILAIAF